MWTGFKLVTGWRPRIKVDCGAISRHRVFEIVLVGRDMHRGGPIRVVLYIDSVGSKLVGVKQRMVEGVAHPKRLVKNENRGQARRWISDSRSATDDWNVANRLVAVGIRRHIAFSCGVVHDDGVTAEHDCICMRVKFHAAVNRRTRTVIPLALSLIDR